jgi:hypothetical protein
MAKIPQLFISYKTGIDDGLTLTANTVSDFLTGEGYTVWMDQTKMVPGEDWNTQIYEAIARSDMVLLLLAEKTAASEWVRREIDVARGAQVYILPVLIRGDFDVKAALEHFDMPRRQYVTFKENSADERKKLLEGIKTNLNKTRDRQEEWLLSLREDQNTALFKNAYIPTKKAFSVHSLSGSDCKIILAAGDMTRMRDIDVLVNTENNYMQMARLFESFSLSSKLRLYGSQRNSSGAIREDTVQQELYVQTAKTYSLPITMGYVVPTHAGHPESRLVKNGARYIFHVAAVQVQHSSRNNAIIPLDNEGIAEAVYNCLDMVIEVNEARGVISPEGSPLRAQEEQAASTYKPIESMILPLFATGRGGREREIADVSQTMLLAFREYLSDSKNCARLGLKALHLCAYSELDVHTVKAEMDNVLRS